MLWSVLEIKQFFKFFQDNSVIKIPYDNSCHIIWRIECSIIIHYFRLRNLRNYFRSSYNITFIRVVCIHSFVTSIVNFCPRLVFSHTNFFNHNMAFTFIRNIFIAHIKRGANFFRRKYGVCHHIGMQFQSLIKIFVIFPFWKCYIVKCIIFPRSSINNSSF